MTDDQRRQERGMLLVEIEEQERLIADIRTRNDRLADAFTNVGETLRGHSGSRIAMPLPQDVAGFVDLQKVRDVIAELAMAQQRLTELKQRKGPGAFS